MEDTLRVQDNQAMDRNIRVLILVLMEDTLRVRNVKLENVLFLS